MAGAIARRAVLQAGAVTGGLALAGWRSTPVWAAPTRDKGQLLSGSIGQHIRLDLARGAIIRMAHLDEHRRPIRELGESQVPLEALYHGGTPTAVGTPVQRVCQQAGRLAMDVVSVDWDVPSEACAVNAGRIVHAASGRSITYQVWVDIL